MTTRRSFLTAGSAATLVAALPSKVHATPTTTTTAATMIAKKTGSSLHTTITTMCINTLKEVSTPGPQRSLINPGEVHAHLTQFFNLLESTGVNAKIDTHIKSNGGFAKTRGDSTSAPFSTKDLTFFVEELKAQGVALSKNDVHTINTMLNSRSQFRNVAHMVDTHGIAKTQRAVVAASHPRAEERWELYEKAVAQLKGDPSESKMLVAEGGGEGGGQYYGPVWNPTGWWWWNDWQSWEHWRAQMLLEEEVQMDDPGCACLTDWPDPDDPTNYTIYTEDVLDANIVNNFANGANHPYNFCKVWNSLSGFTLGGIIGWLKANPLVLAEVAFWMGVAPEAVLIMGILVAITLIFLSGFC